MTERLSTLERVADLSDICLGDIVLSEQENVRLHDCLSYLFKGSQQLVVVSEQGRKRDRLPLWEGMTRMMLHTEETPSGLLAKSYMGDSIVPTHAC